MAHPYKMLGGGIFLLALSAATATTAGEHHAYVLHMHRIRVSRQMLVYQSVNVPLDGKHYCHASYREISFQVHIALNQYRP